METRTSSFVLLELGFRTLTSISGLPHFHGAHWSAMIRYALRLHLRPGRSVHEEGIMLLPTDTGVISYRVGESIALGLSFPSAAASAVSSALCNLHLSEYPDGVHFRPGRTVELVSTVCRLCDSSWPGCDCRLDPASLDSEAKELAALGRFTLHFTTPLRLSRSKGVGLKGHRYCDESYWEDHSRKGDTSPIGLVLNGIRGENAADHFVGETALEHTTLRWLDVPYGKKTLGGVMGKAVFSGTLKHSAARLLVLGQHTGAGKHPSFGLGFYYIPELLGVSRVRPLNRALTLLERVASPERIDAALRALSSSSPGPDGITVQDLKKAGESYLEKLGRRFVASEHRFSPPTLYQLSKPDGGKRAIRVFNAADRLLHKSAADLLTAAVEKLLSSSSFAYRRGLNREGAAKALRAAMRRGYRSGVKADIENFFGSVDRERLMESLEALFPKEPLVERIREMFAVVKGDGLPQGSPLSPVLSNLYLDRFDRDMEREGMRLVRYADDFVLLFRDTKSDRFIDLMRSSLARLGLRLQETKLATITEGKGVDFLGYVVSAQDLDESCSDSHKAGRTDWTPAFKENLRHGSPVYLTTLCRGARSDGAYIKVRDEQGREESIPWNRMSRLVVVGRSSFSGGVVYRSLRMGVPITFIDIMGRTRGHLYPEGHDLPDMTAEQNAAALDTNFCLCFARAIVAAKVENSIVLLRRNKAETKKILPLRESIRRASSMEELRGLEGAAAKEYFRVFAGLVSPLEFKGRVYHPPEGPVNAMLSLGYSLLYNRLAGVLRVKGFDPRKGFYHCGRGRHAALASDLIEELRHITERVVLALIHKKELGEEDFTYRENRGLILSRLGGEGFRKYIRRFETTMASTFTREGEKLSYNAYLDEMVDTLRRTLKLRIPYRPLVIR